VTKKKSKSRKQRPLLDAVDNSEHDYLDTASNETAIALHEAAESRYLNYALSVITSRALPDVRDGLKPVQRRILYTMWRQKLTSDAKPRKCAKVVGDVMGSYHPHGDSAIYDTLVRMAQPFALRYPLIQGIGNFGSLDGDSAAAMRYTECRLDNPSTDLLSELDRDTVAFRPNYDGSKQEPAVLPSRIPNLLINGATGIAVGMATNIPPHHLGEVCTALLKLLDNPELSSSRLCRYIKGPDFPTGGQILNTSGELKEIYETGSGTIRLRATWEKGPMFRNTKTIFITSVPYATNKGQLIEQIAEIILAKKLPPLLDVTDQSTEKVRIALELKSESDDRLVMAYLFKHTPLQTNFSVNLTCLVPTGQSEVSRPERLKLHETLRYFLQFRLDVVTRRLEHELETLKKRIHVLEGFVRVFDALDSIIKLIRRSDGKTDAAEQIMRKFPLDPNQTDAILELKIYRLARLEILVVREELESKRKRARQIKRLLNNENSRWKIVGEEIKAIQKEYGNSKTNPRRTIIETVKDDVEYSDDDFIVDEDCVVLISRDGWIKRQKEVRDISNTRLREGDELLETVVGSTRSTCVFFSNLGTAYSCRLVDVPASTGHGEPIQKLFRLKDGEHITTATSLDPRVTSGIHSKRKHFQPATHAITISSDGFGLRFSLEPFVEPSTKMGRRYAKPSKGAELVDVKVLKDVNAVVIVATKKARALLCKARDINFLAGPGKGVMLIKLKKEVDAVLGFTVSTSDREFLTVQTNRGATQNISTAKYGVTARGGKGRELLQRGEFTQIVQGPIEITSLTE